MKQKRGWGWVQKNSIAARRQKKRTKRLTKNQPSRMGGGKGTDAQITTEFNKNRAQVGKNLYRKKLGGLSPEKDLKNKFLAVRFFFHYALGKGNSIKMVLCRGPDSRIPRSTVFLRKEAWKAKRPKKILAIRTWCSCGKKERGFKEKRVRS